ncbi:MAG: hemolysin family protein [Candidatus Heteroscillospira sp.]|jgi:putative hemolysin
MGNYVWYAILVVLIAMSGFFSASEMAFSSANRIRIENLMEAGDRRARAAFYITEHFDDALSAILIGNNLVNIASSSIATIVAILVAGEEYTAVATAIITVLIIIFGETMPKILAKKNANRFSLSAAYIVRALTCVLRPVIVVVVWLINLITRNMGEADEEDEDAAVEELQSIIETVEDEGVIDGDRSELLQAALDFSEISASEVMTARVDMLAIDIDDDPKEIFSVIEEAPYSRVPVYEDSVDNIIGVLYLNHYFKAMVDGGSADIRSIMIQPCYVYKTMKLPAVLGELKRRKTHMAVVTDEYGGSMGIITMEDVLEQLVGEIWDETDEIEPEVIETSTGVYELDGDLSISDFLELMQWDEDAFDTDSATVGGWCIEMLGHFPVDGECFEYENLSVRVDKMDGLRVDQLTVTVNPSTPKDE